MTISTSRSKARRTALPAPVVSCLLALCLVAGLAAIAQEDSVAQEAGKVKASESDSIAPSEIFIDSVDVNLVNVEVYVTDRKGDRVTGLAKDDFELFEDGRPVEITNFYAVEDGIPVSEAPVSESGEDPVPLETLELERRRPGLVAVPEEQRLHLIIYVDNLFIKPFNRNKVVRQTRQFLRQKIRPGDRVMMVTFERSLHVRQGFTEDMNLISEALHDIETLSAFAQQASTQRRQVINNFERAETYVEAEGHVDFYAKALHFDVVNTVRGLKELVSSLAGLPGRKAILHVSDGIPMTPGEDLFYMLDSQYGDQASGLLRSRRYSTRRQWGELTAGANANRVTFYTLEAAGLRSHSSLSAEYGGAVNQEGIVAGSRIDVDIVRVSSYQETLDAMALDTGGLSILNTNNFALAFDKMATDFRTYYSLGYLPAHSGDGRYHDIKVKMKKKGLRARHRTGYRDKTAETHLSEGTLSALLYGYESNPMGVELHFQSLRRNENDQILLPIEVRVPLGKATLVPQADLYRGQLRFSVAVIDEDGRMSPVEQTPVPLNIPGAEIEIARQKFYVYEAQLLMRKGNQRVAVGVRDDLAGESSYVRKPIQIGARSG